MISTTKYEITFYSTLYIYIYIYKIQKNFVQVYFEFYEVKLKLL